MRYQQRQQDKQEYISKNLTLISCICIFLHKCFPYSENVK